MVIDLTCKRDSTTAVAAAERVLGRLLEHGDSVVMMRCDAACFSAVPQSVRIVEKAADAVSDCHAVIAVGGDGTIFHAASDAMAFGKPVLGINAGHLGFLAQMEADDLTLLDAFLAGNYEVERCFVLEAEVFHRHTGERQVLSAVNDMVLSKPDFGHLTSIEVRCFGDLVGQYLADGIIFATPTGSTAYSLSAGGPISDPTVSCILMTPLASHSLVSRTIIFSEEKELVVTVPKNSRNKLYLTVDGKAVDTIGEDATVTIRKSEHRTRFIRLPGRSFYRILNEKMRDRG